MKESLFASNIHGLWDGTSVFHLGDPGLKGGLAIGTMFMMVAISAMNGLSVAGMAIGA